MKKANISYTRNHLSQILARVREGESFLIMDRQTPVARLEPIGDAPGAVAEWRADLVRRGVLRPAETEIDLARLAEVPLPEVGCGGDILKALAADRDEAAGRR